MFCPSTSSGRTVFIHEASIYPVRVELVEPSWLTETGRFSEQWRAAVAKTLAQAKQATGQ